MWSNVKRSLSYGSLIVTVMAASFADLRRESTPQQSGPAQVSYRLTLEAPKAEARKVVRRIGRAFRRVARGIGRAIRGVVRRVGRAIGKVGRFIGKAVKTVGKGLAKGFRAIGKGIVQIGKGVVQVAKGVGKIAKSVVKGAVKFGGGLLKGLGRVVRGDFKGAARAVRDGARAAGKTIWRGVKAGGKLIVKGVGNVVKGVGNVALGAVQVALPFVDAEKVLKWIKNNIIRLLKTVGQKILNSRLGGVIMKLVGAGDVADAIRVVTQVIQAVQTIANAIKNPDEYLQQGRQWAVNKLTDLAFGVFEKPVLKLVGALTGAGIKLLKHFVTTPLTAAISAGLASFTFGIGGVLAPLIKLGIDKLLDWAIDQVKMLMAKAVMGIKFVKDFLRNKVIGPVVNKIYDKVIAFIKKKVPAVRNKLSTSEEAGGAL